MGYIKHEFTVVFLPEYSDGFHEAIKKIQELMVEESGEYDFRRCIAGPSTTMSNGLDVTYLLGPDGSKEGWDCSDSGELFREAFIAAAQLCERSHIYHFGMAGDSEHEKPTELYYKNGSVEEGT